MRVQYRERERPGQWQRGMDGKEELETRVRRV